MHGTWDVGPLPLTGTFTCARCVAILLAGGLAFLCAPSICKILSYSMDYGTVENKVLILVRIEEKNKQCGRDHTGQQRPGQLLGV